MKGIPDDFLEETSRRMSGEPPFGRETAGVPSWDLFLRLHFLLCSVGLAKILAILSMRVVRAIQPRVDLGQFFDWTLPFLFPQKRLELVTYAALIVGFSGYFALAYAVLRPRCRELLETTTAPLRTSSARFALYLAAAIAVNATVASVGDVGRLHQTGLLHLAFRGGAWLVVFLAPFLMGWSVVRPVLAGWEERAQTAWTRCRVLAIVSIGLLMLQTASIFLPYLQGRLWMLNEYFDLPQQTRLDGRWVDNSEYINEHRILNLLKYDMEKGIVPVERYGLFAKVPKTPNLARFIESKGLRYSYDERMGALVVYDEMTPEEKEELRDALGKGSEAVVEELYYSSRDREKKSYSKEEQDFLKKNYRELIGQTLNRSVVHHHNFILAPINEHALGRPLSEINVQYGLLNIVVMKFLLERTGGITYQNYFRVWYSFWPLYYLMLVAFLFLLFRDVRYVLLTCLVAFGLLNRLGHDFLMLGPGLNPVRHFFDVPVAALLVLFLRRRNDLFFALALGLSLLGIVNNKQFGFFLLVSLAATVLLAEWKEAGRIASGRLALALAGMLAGIWLYASQSLGVNPLMPYYLIGFVGIPVDPKFFPTLILSLGAAYLILLKSADVEDEVKYPALFFFLYAQGALVYYVWGGTHPHFLNLSTIVALASVCLLRLLLRHSPARRFESLTLATLAAGALAAVYLPSAAGYYLSLRAFHRSFEDHPVYEWDLDRARFRSTMDPKYFQEAVTLIRERADGNGIFILSKYDNFLPFLSGKYSAMPFFDVPWYLMTDLGQQECIERIRSAKPAVLFVDTDIERSLNGDAFHSTLDGFFPADLPEASNPRLRIDMESGSKSIRDFATGEHRFVRGDYIPSLAQESGMRVERLSHLREIFDAVKDDYEAVERGALITAYRRKHPKEPRSTR